MNKNIKTFCFVLRKKNYNSSEWMNEWLNEWPFINIRTLMWTNRERTSLKRDAFWGDLLEYDCMHMFSDRCQILRDTSQVHNIHRFRICQCFEGTFCVTLWRQKPLIIVATPRSPRTPKEKHTMETIDLLT